MKTLYTKFIFILILLSTAYGCFSICNMLFDNQTPYTLSAEGIILQKDKVYTISNTERITRDTIFLHFENAKELMPQTLCHIYFNNKINEFVVKNSDSITNTKTIKDENYILPFCRTYNNKFYEKEQYFKSNETITEKTMLENGIKYNISGGEKETRVTVEFIKYNKSIALKLKDDGIKTSYPVKKDTLNFYEVCFNRQPETSYSFVYAFDNTVLDTGTYTIKINPHLSHVEVSVFNQNNQQLIKQNSYLTTAQVQVGKVLFQIKKRYSFIFTISYLLFFVVIILFQIALYRKLIQYNNPLVRAFLSIRIILNTIVFMGIPVFLHSVVYHNNRWLYLVLVIILNISVVLTGKKMRLIDLNNYKIFLTLIFIGTLIFAPFILKAFSSNESFFGVPVLHIQKLLLLMIYFLVSKYGKFFKGIASIAYCLIISIFTKDLGSSIYTILALLLIEYIRKTISIKKVAGILAVCTLVLAVYLKVNPEKLSEPKYYRIVAPFLQPNNDFLKYASEADRESVSILVLNLKNVLKENMPIFNEVMIPANLKSTMHSDYVFHASLLLGNFYFFILYLIITITLLYNILFILYCTLNKFRISETEIFSFPQNQWADIVVFLLSITFISFVYPILSNLLIIPVTGQSIPLLSTSWVEVLFIIFLITVLENIFKNTNYTTNTDYQITQLGFVDILIYINKNRNTIIVLLLSLIIYKAIVLTCFTNNIQSWTKPIPYKEAEMKELVNQKKELTKKELITFANTYANGESAIAVKNDKRSVLKNINSMIYTGKPYFEIKQENKEFRKDTKKCLSQISLNTIFDNDKKEISDNKKPFGKVYSIQQQINSKSTTSFSNKIYAGCLSSGDSVNNDLHAECNFILKRHIEEIGNLKNIGSIMIVDNKTRNIITAASFPLSNTVNANTKYYLTGSLKKTILAYAALAIDADYEKFKVGNITFTDFLKNSSDTFSACLLKDILRNHREEFDATLTENFDMPLYAYNMKDAYFDILPQEKEFTKPLDKYNSIFRLAIGQQKPYQFLDMVQWYSRIATNKKIQFNTGKKFDKMSLNNDMHSFLEKAMNSVLYGTAVDVRISLAENDINTDQFVCKTGTAEHPSKKFNNSSSFIIANNSYTVAVMLNGKIPYNDKKLSARILFIKLIPTLIEYKILD